MIYNLVQYIKAELTTLVIFCNGFQTPSTDDVVEVSENGGEESPWNNRQEYTISFISRSVSVATARKNSISVYTLLKKRYRLELPAVTVDSVVYPKIKTWAIRPIAIPQFAGLDDKGRNLFVFSLEITTSEK